MVLDETLRELLVRFEPSPTALLGWLRGKIGIFLLEQIAAADYGSDYKEHLQALERIRDFGEIPVPLHWIPGEVLELIRWSEPEDPTWKPGRVGVRGHIMRAFCCTVLLKAAAEPESRPYVVSENATVVQLIASALVLGRPAPEYALGLLCWRMMSDTVDDEERPFFALGVLLLRCALTGPDEGGADLKALTEWVFVEESRARRSEAVLPESDRWLFGLTCFDQKRDTWIRLAQEVLLAPDKPHPALASESLRAIGMAVVEGRPGEQTRQP